jgi:hypothetical protein
MRIPVRKSILIAIVIALIGLVLWQRVRAWAQDAGTVFMGGVLVLIGGSSGEDTLEVPAAAGTPTQTFPTNSGSIVACTTTGTGVTGGGTMATGGNSCFAKITGSAATGNVFTPGITCPHETICLLSDRTHPGVAAITASSPTTCTYSATASDTVDIGAGCI